MPSLQSSYITSC